MTKVIWASFQQLFDNFGDVLNGGTLTFYAGGTSTPKTAYADDTGNTALANPLTLDSAGREQGGIWFTEGEAYKVLLKSSASVTLDTIDNITLGDVEGSDDLEYEVQVFWSGTPGAQELIGGIEFKRSVIFPANFAGSGGSVVTNPGSDYAIDIQKNGETVGTATVSSAGAYTFTTTAGAAVSVSDGDTFDVYAPDSAGTAAGIKFTLVGELA